MWKLNIFMVKLLDTWGLMITRNAEAWFPMGLCLLFQLIVLCCDSKMDYVKVQPARRPSIAPPRTPESPHMENTLTEKGITLLSEVRFTNRALITMLFYVSVDSLLSVSKKHTCTCSLLHKECCKVCVSCHVEES